MLAPATLSANLNLAGATYLNLVWQVVVDSDLPTLGHSLELLQDNDIWTEVFNAQFNPNALSTTVIGLKTAKQYTFRSFAFNFNGKSLPSGTF